MNLEAIFLNLGIFSATSGQFIMLGVGMIILYLAISKKFEPLLLLPIGFGAILTNIPEIGLALSPIEKLIYAGYPDQLAGALSLIVLPESDSFQTFMKTASHSQLWLLNEYAQELGYKPGILSTFYTVAIASGVAPLVIFMGVGAMTDFGPMLANPKTLILGAAAQFGIFATVIGALLLNHLGLVSFTLQQAAATGIIGGADGPTAIYVSSILAPELLGAIAVAAYSYMALVPLIQPPIMRLLTTDSERKIRMVQLREVSQREKIIFPLILVLLVGMLLPSAAPLIGMFCFGNLMRESLVVERLSDVVQNSLINVVTIFLGLAVGSKLAAEFDEVCSNDSHSMFAGQMVRPPAAEGPQSGYIGFESCTLKEGASTQKMLAADAKFVDRQASIGNTGMTMRWWPMAGVSPQMEGDFYLVSGVDSMQGLGQNIDRSIANMTGEPDPYDDLIECSGRTIFAWQSVRSPN